ncbi:HTH-type transcriptional regulator CysL [BD1-7 clade bacterium]|uniref:HTH-type transcriptional regulator CysL n=1 Tax=BD1-7 clade bacterium TaxID=2029982 RepID=A0A5S9MRZ0_9GAMM|nr:HTH-type transcriptional regulator CysL [BD1-7 clade bacterium]CAA0084429.1 HTH-type transcriptional regulator CysL [BD1-7 clade bacterium]
MRITLKQLRVFAAVAQSENMTQAADSIALTQSAMSMALKEFESQLNTPLFHRHGKRIKLNPVGHNLLPKVLQLLQLAEEIERMATSDALAGQLRIGASSTIGNYLAPSIIAQFLLDYPDIDIDLKVGNTQQIIADVSHLRLDMGLIEGLCDIPQIERTVWRHDELRIFAAANHPLAQKQANNDEITAADLAACRWILRETGSGTREIFTNATHRYLNTSERLLELGNSEAIKQAVKTGFGISCLSELAIASELRHGELVALDVSGLKDLDLHRQLFIIKNRSQVMSRLEQTFEHKLLEHGNLDESA